MKLKFKEREWGGCTKIYMTVLKNLLPAQRHLILVCQNYSVCMKSWPRAPELQVKEGEGNSRRGGSCHLGCWTWMFLFLPKYSAFCSPFHAVGVGMCPLWPVLFIHCCKKCLLCALTVQKRRCPRTYLLAYYSAHSGSCTQWYSVLVFALGESGVPSRLALLRPWASGLICPWSALLSRIWIFQSIWFISW